MYVFAISSGLEKTTKLMAGRYPDVVMGLMLAIETDTGVVKVDEDAVWLLGLLVINLVYCVLGYRFVCDPFGTVDPAWRGIFWLIIWILNYLRHPIYVPYVPYFLNSSLSLNLAISLSDKQITTEISPSNLFSIKYIKFFIRIIYSL